MDETLLDNPAWWALNGPQAEFARGDPDAVRYADGVLTFAALREPTAACMDQLAGQVIPGEQVYLIGDIPPLSSRWTLVQSLDCAQMLAGPAGFCRPDSQGAVLEPGDEAALYDLVNLVQPGYFERNTHLLGRYYGIRAEGRFAAVAGERMRLPGFSELSAIVTRPGYTGRGFAKSLISELCSWHRSQGVQSCLHVALTNQRAVGIYEAMGFVARRTITFQKLARNR
ncbi:hypothetical protein C7T94_13770 [Pedobacter yulinensis]|uniref:N-acetyltransferase domain-containing protein n=1 Tax=Pedobacter yulinensis TaxID=2126353 RepID=A0A2T3HME4_9SPHI|nr:GNAT family N-acetyltransferase [Pedobacter yulinensis]PST83604.1 hypothetical protein C7T94_13770 [Pedobacter yulinensis]